MAKLFLFGFLLVCFTSLALAGPLHEKKDVLQSTKLMDEDVDIMTRIKDINEENDLNLFESDILLLEDEPVADEEGNEKRNARRNRGFLWKNKIVPYEISPELAGDTSKILEALHVLSNQTCLKFVSYDGAKHSNWINFIKGSGCWSSVGRRFWQQGGQDLSLANGCTRRGTIQHEVLHALGFFHEQSRPDRNQYVEIFWENIKDGQEHNFNKYNHFTIDTQKKPYDFASIMHYGGKYFSKNGQATIRAISNPNQQIGQRIGLSKLDIDEVNDLYDCSNSLTSWTSWSDFTPCDQNCNKNRERFCNSQAQDMSQDCPGVNQYGVEKETVPCSVQECTAPVDGHWARWSSWASCNASCGPGTRTRTRKCQEPAPAHGGSDCSGDSNQQMPCFFGSCGLGPFDNEFENDTNPLGIWSQDTTDELDWVRAQGSTPSRDTGPTGDHTSKSGHYLYLEASNPANLGDRARLTADFPGSPSSVCFVMSYNMYGAGMGSLNIYLEKSSTGRKPLASKSGNQGELWDTLRIDLNSASSYKIIIEATCGSNYTSDIAIDDLFFTSGSCDSKPSRFDNDFENDTNPLGIWSQDTTDEMDWVRAQGSTPSRDTGPKGDHTSKSGHYLYLEASYPAKAGDRARLTAGFPGSSSSVCFVMSYNMYGAYMGSLNIYLEKSSTGRKLLATKSGNQGELWDTLYIDLNSASSYKIIIEATCGSDYTSDIAIDDLFFTSGSCGSKPSRFDNDFENDANPLGIWSQDTTDEMDWVRAQGSTPSRDTGPKGDHTSKSGHYLYLEASYPAKAGDRARLTAGFPGLSSSVCFVMSYNMYGAYMGSLNIYLEKSSTGRKLLATKSGNQGELWDTLRIDLNSASSYKIIIEATRGSDYTSDIAIDDLFFTSGSCGSKPNTRRSISQ